MLAQLQDPAVEAARTTRELLAKIQSSMAAQQGGEAFMDMPEIPPFLRRKRGEPPDTTPMPEWILKKRAERPQNTFKRIEDMPDPDAGASNIELQARALKRGAAAELKAKDQATAEAKEAKARDKRNKRLGLPDDAPASNDPLPAGYWDATANKWRPEGYMSLSRYRRLLLGMPGPAYRAAFIKAYGHTQEERHRNPDDKTMRLLRHTMGLAEVRELPATGDAGPSAPAKQPTAKAAPAAPRKVTVLEKLAKATAPAKPKAAKDSIAQSKSVGPEGNRVTTERESQMLALLDRPQGCTLEELGAPFKWLPHTAGARLSALKHHHTIAKAKEDRGTVYRRVPK